MGKFDMFAQLLGQTLTSSQKPASIGDNGKVADETTWGAMKADRTTKFSLKC
jgi:hypothetical protein